ncbi:uncharacterized protein LOC117002817 [Catharus ustulatus]|uniref:uncharacterized protein LOC117002817 n=1 Tax=Catharus ustulatus TaxID=91951 RepID=UPI001409ED56|nr:uncharacterized protein LOC117002817 [Catharus ustulatus]
MPRPPTCTALHLWEPRGVGMAQPSRCVPGWSIPDTSDLGIHCSNRKDQKALGGCYGNSHKLDQYLVQGAVCVTDVGAGGCDRHSGVGGPWWHPAAQAVSLFWAGLWQYLSSQGPRHGVPPPSRSLCTPQGGEGWASWGWLAEIPPRKYFQLLPQTPAEPSTWCRGGSGPCANSPTVGRGAAIRQRGHCSAPWPGEPRTVPITASHSSPLCGAAPDPASSSSPVGTHGCRRCPGHTAPGSPDSPAWLVRDTGTLCWAKGQEGACGRAGTCRCHGPVRPERGSGSAPRSSSGTEPSYEEDINIC